jgi:hypothetical protein
MDSEKEWFFIGKIPPLELLWKSLWGSQTFPRSSLSEVLPALPTLIPGGNKNLPLKGGNTKRSDGGIRALYVRIKDILTPATLLRGPQNVIHPDNENGTTKHLS